MALRVLIVEDQVPGLQSTRLLLDQEGHAITLVASCAEARALAATFDVAGFQLVVANGLGVDLAEELLQDRRIARVIFLSGAEDPALTERARSLGAVVPTGNGASLRRAVAGK